METNSTSSRSTTTTWYDTRFPSISIIARQQIHRSHSIEPSYEPTPAQRQTRCTRTSAGSSATLWTEEYHPFLVLSSSPRPRLLTSIEVRNCIEDDNHMPCFGHNHTTDCGIVFINIDLSERHPIDFRIRLEQAGIPFSFCLVFPRETSLLQRFYKRRVFYWCLPWRILCGSLGV